jgi:hypothetical protein
MSITTARQAERQAERRGNWYRIQELKRYPASREVTMLINYSRPDVEHPHVVSELSNRCNFVPAAPQSVVQRARSSEAKRPIRESGKAPVVRGRREWLNDLQVDANTRGSDL